MPAEHNRLRPNHNYDSILNMHDYRELIHSSQVALTAGSDIRSTQKFHEISITPYTSHQQKIFLKRQKRPVIKTQ